MVSLKMSKKDAAEQSVCSPCDASPYPYGTELRLDDDLLVKLGVKELPPVGSTFAMIAICEVVDTSARENKDGAEQSLSMQITDMQIDLVGKTNDQRAKKLYPDQD